MPSQVLEAYQSAKSRAILLDWGGTLTPANTDFYDVRSTDAYALPESVLEVLRTLCADPANHVMILSGLSRDKVEEAFKEVPDLSLAAEHGFHYRIKGGPWRPLLTGVDTSWRQVVDKVMQVYTKRAHGTFVQQKGSSILWNYANADPEFGAIQVGMRAWVGRVARRERL